MFILMVCASTRVVPTARGPLRPVEETRLIRGRECCAHESQIGPNAGMPLLSKPLTTL